MIWAGSGADAKFIRLKEVVLFAAEDKYIRVLTPTASYKIEDSLASLEQRLGKSFLRTHRRYLVRLTAVNAIVDIGVSKFLEVRGVMEPVPVSRRELPTVREMLRTRAI